MSKKKGRLHWESLLFGLVLGIAGTVAAEAVYHQIAGMVRMSRWERSVTEQQHEPTVEILNRVVATSHDAMAEDRPTQTSRYLASGFMDRLYEHQMSYASWLLKAGEIDEFNRVRQSTVYLRYNLSGLDLKGRTLSGVDFSYADLAHSDFSDCDLSGAYLTGSDFTGATLIGATLEDASMFQCNLTNALLNGVNGGGADFREAVLANASLTSVKELPGARFDGAILADANLWDSSFSGAVFDRADLTMASAVDCDLGQVESMANAVLTGANLAGAKLSPERCPKAWLVNAEGVDNRTQQGLRANGGIFSPDDVVNHVDDRIVAGFRAQIEEDPEVQPDQRRRVLISMLQDYYQMN